jgi:uncharacterized Ntn-hydrolase superfamily protein
MTFSISGRCAETGQLGIAIATSSIAVGARCPWVRPGVGVVATQNVTLPGLGPLILDELACGSGVEAALRAGLATDQWAMYRQVTVLDCAGNAAVFSGSETLGVHNTVVGKDCVAGGNLLANVSVISAMVAAFETTSGLLADRLLAAVHAAIAAGGEAGPVRSAAVKVAADVTWPIVDLRVDWSQRDPIGELSALWELYRPQMHDYLTRALNPSTAPSYGVPGNE